MPQWLLVLVNVVAVMTIVIAFTKDTNYNKADQIERPGTIRKEGIVLSRRVTSPSLFFLHLLKCKQQQYQRLEKISSTTARPATTTAVPCICVPFYLCTGNQTIITDGTGVIDIRAVPRIVNSRNCTGLFEVCCVLSNITTPIPTLLPTILPTLPPIVTPTIRPTILPTLPPIVTPTITPTITPTPPVTILPNLTCICVLVSQCDPNGIVTITGEGVINPRQGIRLCPNANQVCCRILANIVQPSNTMTTTTTMPSPSGQLCYICNNTVQCVNCGTIIMPILPTGNFTIEPRFPMLRNSLCSLSNEQFCQLRAISPNTELLGELKNPGTSQACYCVKTWMCISGNVISPDGLGIIDSRFTQCSSADEVCCRSTGIDLQVFRSVVDSVPLRYVASGTSNSLSASQTICGVRNNNYAPSQIIPIDSGKTYFTEFPWMVALLTKSTSGPYVFHCGASLINSRVILTAAHCITNQKPEDLVARLGQWQVDNNNQQLPIQEANIFKIITHPTYYSGGLFHDIALLILEKDIVYSANILPICLPEQGMVFVAGTRCFGTGWSSNSFETEEKYQAELRKVDVPIIDRADCQSRLRNTRLGQYFQLHGSFICAGGESNKDTCRGDGGGPLSCQTHSGQYFQAGIVSWGIGCGTFNVPAVYTSVSQHRQWIDKELATYGVQ